MLVLSFCTQVVRSRFVDSQRSFKDFAELIALHNAPNSFKAAAKKDELPLFMPAEYPEQTVVRRCAANVLAVHLLVLDIDRGSDEDIFAAFENFEHYGYIIYTSFSHKPDGQHKYRVMLKLSRPVGITEWKAFFPRALQFLGVKKLADEKCSDPCHMYYLPGGDRGKYWTATQDGEGLDVDFVLQQPLPEGVRETPIEGYTEILPEAERGEISEGLKDYWNAELSNLSEAIQQRPYPGPIYDLKVHKVYYLARGCDHIVGKERLRKTIVYALDRRYRWATDKDKAAADRERSLKQVDKAIEDGMNVPWWPPLINEVPVRSFDEFGLADRLIDQHQDDIGFEPIWNTWLTWNEKHWDQEAGASLVQERMKQTVLTIESEKDAHYAEYAVAKKIYESTLTDADVSDELQGKAEFEYEEKKKLIEGIEKFAAKSRTAAKVSAGIRLASSSNNVMTSHQKFNKNPWYLNFQNGTVDLRTGQFHKHLREDYITRITPVEYQPRAACPTFDKFLDQIMLSNPRMVEFLWRIMGYSAVGVTDEQKLFLCHGDGANGKSTLLSVLLDLFGQGGTGYGHIANSSNLLTNKGGDQHPSWRMDMFGKRYVAALEVEEGRTFAESLIKELTGGDTITGRRMREDNWSYKPEFALFLAVNHLPHIRGTDEGIWRRLCILPFEANFRDVADKDLSRKLLAEGPGIMARIVHEARKWCKEGLTLPREVVLASAQFRNEQNPLNDFMEKWCVLEANAETPRDNLWAAYEEHTATDRARTFHERKRFYAALEKQFEVKKIRGLRVFSGVRIKTPTERLESMPRAILARAQGRDDKKSGPN